MSVELLERAAAALGPLLGEVMFVGGATVPLWITDPAAPPPRATKDVDVVVEVFRRADLHDFERRLRAQGFREDQQSAVICRWQYQGDQEEPLILDAMPAAAALMGFANRWQREALPHAVERLLPSERPIKAITPPYFIATKLEAFAGRGAGDHLLSRDLEDIVVLVDGREEIVAELREAPVPVRRHVQAEFRAQLDNPAFVEAVRGFLRPDAASQQRADAIVLPRLRSIRDHED